MWSPDMKYQFNKIFSFFNKEQNDGKPPLGPNLGLLGPNFGHTFFLVASALVDAKHCPKL